MNVCSNVCLQKNKNKKKTTPPKKKQKNSYGTLVMIPTHWAGSTGHISEKNPCNYSIPKRRIWPVEQLKTEIIATSIVCDIEEYMHTK